MQVRFCGSAACYHLLPGRVMTMGYREQLRQARELLQKIQSFAGGRVNEVRPVDLKEILRKTSTIFANTRGGITVRRKLEETPGSPQHFITEPGLGYRFEP